MRYHATSAVWWDFVTGVTGHGVLGETIPDLGQRQVARKPTQRFACGSELSLVLGEEGDERSQLRDTRFSSMTTTMC